MRRQALWYVWIYIYMYTWYTIRVSWYVSFLWEHQESIVEKLKSNSCKKRWRHTVKISWLLGWVVQCWSKWGSMKPNVHQNISTRICRTRLGYSLFSCGSCECWQMLPLLDPFSIRLAAPCDAIFTMAGWQSRKRGVWEGSMMFYDVPWCSMVRKSSRTLAFCLCGGCCNWYHVILGWFSVNPTEFHRGITKALAFSTTRRGRLKLPELPDHLQESKRSKPKFQVFKAIVPLKGREFW